MKISNFRFVRIYPRAVFRLIVVLLAASGYFLILTVIYDLAVLRFSVNGELSDIMSELLNMIFYSSIFLPIAYLSSELPARDIRTDIKSLLYIFLARVEVLLLLAVIGMILPGVKNILIPLMLFIPYLLIKYFKVNNEIVRPTNCSVTSKLSYGAVTLFSELLILYFICILFVISSPLTALFAALPVLIVVTVTRNVKLKYRYKEVISFLGWILLIYILLSDLA